MEYAVWNKSRNIFNTSFASRRSAINGSERNPQTTHLRRDSAAAAELRHRLFNGASRQGKGTNQLTLFSLPEAPFWLLQSFCSCVWIVASVILRIHVNFAFGVPERRKCGRFGCIVEDT
ncbi:hypothetical protein AKJ16_DCAP02385 [Drosera capensis]